VLHPQHRSRDNEQEAATVTQPQRFVLRTQHIACEAGGSLPRTLCPGWRPPPPTL